jgi:hypothetical protein
MQAGGPASWLASWLAGWLAGRGAGRRSWRRGGRQVGSSSPLCSDLRYSPLGCAILRQAAGQTGSQVHRGVSFGSAHSFNASPGGNPGNPACSMLPSTALASRAPRSSQTIAC